jgi:hypothetical protein
MEGKLCFSLQDKRSLSGLFLRELRLRLLCEDENF